MSTATSRGLVFKKTGLEIKQAVRQRHAVLRERLDRRNAALDEFLIHRDLVRSYIVRSSNIRFEFHGGGGREPILAASDISSEQMGDPAACRADLRARAGDPPLATHHCASR